MAETTGFQSRLLGSLVGSVAGTSSGTIPGDNIYRRYRSGLAIGVYEHGSYTHKRRSIFYEVGRRYGRLTEALAYVHGDVAGIDASVRVNEAQAANFDGWARKYSNFAPSWDYMDLAGIVERLAKGVAAQSVYGGVTCTNLRAGQPVRVVALGTLDSPQTASSSSVFIPRTVDSVGADHVFAVLAAAANGEGASVTTDVLRLDAANNQPVVPNVENRALASACVEALRVLGANMEESGAGDIFAYALTRGIHSVVSVVGHTDEAGWLRGVMRAGSFRVPYGGINQDLRHYPALPPLASLSDSATSAWVDSVALKTAAVVAHCDPCVTASGGVYPTVFTAGMGDVCVAGTPEGPLVAGDERTIGQQISADLSRFSPLYMRGLMAIFGLASNSGVADSHFCTIAADALRHTTDRHLRHRTVAPYFWIEPTSLIPVNFLGTVAESAGFGALTTPGLVTHIPTFERMREMDRSRNADFCTLAFKMRSARTSGLVAAYAGDPGELSGLHLYQFDEDSIVLAGDQGAVVGDVPTKHRAAAPLSSYLWVRGQSPIPAPAEFINTQGAYAAKYKVVTWDNDFNASLSDLPEAWELEEHPTHWRVSVPTGIAPGPSNAADSGAKRARSRAAIALAQATLRSRAFGEAGSPVIEVSNVPPSFDDTPAPTGLTTLEKAHLPTPGPSNIRGEGAATTGAPPVHGGPLNPTMHHMPVRGAPLPRVGGGVLGGVAPRGPPPGPPPMPPMAPVNNPPDLGGDDAPPADINAAPEHHAEAAPAAQ